MTLDTIFDLASLTKVVATTTSVMMLVEQGRIRLSDRVATYIPGFERYGKARHHDPSPADARVGAAARRRSRGPVDRATRRRSRSPSTKCRPRGRASASSTATSTSSSSATSCSGSAGMPLDRFARERIFEPLGMKDTMFNPPASLRPRIAPTESCTRVRLAVPGSGDDDAARRRARSDRAPDGRRGRARRVSSARPRTWRSSAGCCSAAAPFQGARILSPLAVEKMTSAASPEPRRNIARPRLGHRFVVLVQPRRAAADRIVRPHRLHRHVALDRSGDRDVRRLPVEPRPSGRQG